MSNIVAFQRKPRPRPARSEQGPFQLLFFTGVRYVRAEPVATTRKRRRSPRAKDADKRTA
ncbi:MAG: hypothetical protein JWN07_3564 [Hyphomicrobiales bacterium]|nr:hypothetical protein [Hyphomicrobiales bacterium]